MFNKMYSVSLLSVKISNYISENNHARHFALKSKYLSVTSSSEKKTLHKLNI